MTRENFERIVAEEFPRAVPAKFRSKIKNVGLVIESEPSVSVRKEQGLSSDETLLGIYRGVPLTVRGAHYGEGPVMPDVIVLYQMPIEAAALSLNQSIRQVVRSTIWHEVGHFFGLSDDEIERREGHS